MMDGALGWSLGFRQIDFGFNLQTNSKQTKAQTILNLKQTKKDYLKYGQLGNQNTAIQWRS